MNLRSLTQRRIRLLALGIVFTHIGTGCGMMKAKHRSRAAKNAECSEMYGVVDPLFHGYTKTCWRTWDEEAWATTGCPPVGEVSPIPEVPSIPSDPTGPSVPAGQSAPENPVPEFTVNE